MGVGQMRAARIFSGRLAAILSILDQAAHGLDFQFSSMPIE